jgi:hypothetical protein
MSQIHEAELSSVEIPLLLEEYSHAAFLYGEALELGDTNRANRDHKQVSRIYAELRTRGRDAQSKLLDLLGHPNPSVRCWAAVHSLEVSPEQAEPVLAEIAANGPVPLCLSAEVLLSEWRRGTLRLT